MGNYTPGVRVVRDFPYTSWGGDKMTNVLCHLNPEGTELTVAMGDITTDAHYSIKDLIKLLQKDGIISNPTDWMEVNIIETAGLGDDCITVKFARVSAP